MDIGLFERISRELNCIVLSDLRYKCTLEDIKKAIQNIEGDEYTLYEWNDMVEYLFYKKKHFEKIQDAKAYILRNKPEVSAGNEKQDIV